MTHFLAPTDDMYPNVLRENLNREFWGGVPPLSDAEKDRLVKICDRWFNNPAELPSHFFEMTLFGVSQHLGGLANFVAFRNVGNAVESFVLLRDRYKPLTPDEEKWLCAVALDCATSGLPKVVEGGLFHKVILVPQYDYDAKPLQLHGVIALIHREVENVVVASAWQHGLYEAATGFKRLHMAQMNNKVGPYDPQDVTERGPNDLKSWKDAVPWFLTRDQVDEKLGQMIAQGKPPEDWHEFLANAFYDLGYPDPSPLHPKRLYRKLEKAANSKPLLDLTENAQHTATHLSTSVISQTWLDTLQTVLSGMSTIIPDAAQVIFMGYGGYGGFKASHDLPHELDANEACALELVAQWTNIHGQPIHDTPQDNRAVFRHLRRILETDAAIVAIPVYAWRALVHIDWPELHGVFVAIRRPGAPIPDPMTFTAWTLAAQYFLSPLATAYEAGLAAHRLMPPGRWIRLEGTSASKMREEG